MRMPPKAYKTNGILMISAPKMQKHENSLKPLISTKYLFFSDIHIRTRIVKKKYCFAKTCTSRPFSISLLLENRYYEK